MKLQDRHFCISQPTPDVVQVSRPATGEAVRLAWPAVCVSLGGREVRPETPLGPARVRSGRLIQVFAAEGLRFEVSLALTGKPWLRKAVCISSETDQPTPDYVEVDRQLLPTTDLQIRGYRATTPRRREDGREEEGAGVMPGCGYPIMGQNWFAGLEHPAGFNRIVSTASLGTLIALVHHPVWDGHALRRVDAVLGWCDDATAAFADYLKSIRLPRLRAPLVSFCTFWSDPYLGNYEYNVSYAACAAFFRAFASHGLRPDVFTLDAGWNDRQTVFEAKPALGGDSGLIRLRSLAQRQGSALSLWVSHNGPMGIAPEWLKEHGYEVGSGCSAAYCGEGYGVMMDERFVALVRKRLSELVGNVGAVHLKIDWDNECATNAAFDARYPTRDQVRQASLDAFFRIARALRRVNRAVVTRNGWWPSPWWLCHAQHVWLSDSGDSEYAALPSRTPRDSASTHRDLMYYNHLQRDQTPIPLDCFDNHEFPDALRNPFPEDPASWVNAVWLSFFRGSTYLAYTLNPESLEDWQAASLKAVMAFCRAHAKHIFVDHGRMVLGHPGKGEVYGFLQPGARESWCVLRNPLSVPQAIALDAAALVSHPVRGVLQFYPHFQNLKPQATLTLLGHEVKILVLSATRRALPFPEPFQVESAGKAFLYRFPASLAIGPRVQPMVHAIQRLDALECLWNRCSDLPDGRRRCQWFLKTPYRLREPLVLLLARGKGARDLRLTAATSRYRGAVGGFAIPVTVMQPGTPGYGESKNLDVTCDPDLACFALRVPAGGEFNLTLDIAGLPQEGCSLSAWIEGYEAPSRNGVRLRTPPRGFEAAVPCPHPLGFGRVLELPLK
ncbi:MAG: hypothetical protein A3K19_30655 [Lentisphaerae bacterium RIFOXYB12_FULL_65_16]|nr:MAG: hypothetical protein A3K18_01115 [Lentisphaerae bacterium RIFOXYA12_64_32]OGV88779.1 MAG: hypothetical protein A3K19_30655 [Lentisphaerae bacterium RIFOXYB12_FULL_65_16]